jgi:iron(III) transport system substrate-binding protein
MVRHSIRGTVVLAALACVLAACGDGATTSTSGVDEGASTEPNTASTTSAPAESDGFEDLVAAAQAEGEVVFYAAYADEILDAIATAFTDKYDITVSFQRSPSGETKARIEEEIGAGRLNTDVISLGIDPLWQAEMEEHFAELDPAELPSLAAMPEEYRHGTYMEAYQSYYGFVYNTDEMAAEDVPDVQGIIELEGASGRIGTAHPATSNTYASWHTVLYDEWGEETYENYWTTFVQDLSGVLSDSSAPLVAGVAAGELLIIGPTNYGQVSPLAEEGAPVAMAYIDPVLRAPNGFFTFNESPHPNAAKLFIDWSLSEEGLTILCSGGECGTHLDIEGQIELPSGVEAIEAPAERGSEFGPSYVIPFFDTLTGS